MADGAMAGQAGHLTEAICASFAQPAVTLRRHGEGCLAVREVGAWCVTLGPAFGTEAERQALHQGLLTSSLRPLATFLDHRDARALLALEGGLQVVPFGTEFVLRPSEALVAVPKEARSAARKAAKRGVVLREVESFAPHRAALTALNDAWIARSQAGQEMAFHNRPALLEGVCARRFLLEQDGELLGFVELDHAPDAPKRLLLNVVRFAPTRLWGLYLAVVLWLLEALQEEPGIELSLGLVPLAEPGPDVVLQANAWVRGQHALLTRSRSMAYRLEEMERFKAIWVGERRTRHIAFRGNDLFGCAFAISRAMGFEFSATARRQLSRWGAR